MDIFCEYLVKKKSLKDAFIRAGIVLACIALCVLIFVVLAFVLPQFFAALPILWAATIYGSVLLFRDFSIEYEYIFTNGVLDIDIIKGRTKRQSLASIPCRKIESMERLPENFTSERKVVDAIYDYNRSGKYVLTYSVNDELCDVLFQPPEKILVNMKKYNSSIRL